MIIIERLTACPTFLLIRHMISLGFSFLFSKTEVRSFKGKRPLQEIGIGKSIVHTPSYPVSRTDTVNWWLYFSLLSFNSDSNFPYNALGHQYQLFRVPNKDETCYLLLRWLL